MTRFFAFGCSFTQYHWPTWADCIGKEYGIYENWGNCGSGNHYIFNSVFECNQRNRFTENDTVIVQWTNSLREDRYLILSDQFKFNNWPEANWRNRNGWINPGNLHTQNFYDNDFVFKYVVGSERGFLIRDLAYMQAVKSLLDNVGCSYKFLSMTPLMQLNQFTNETFNCKDVINLYENVLSIIQPSFFEVLFDCNWNSRRPIHKIQDNHPLPTEHLEYIDLIMPEFSINEGVRSYCQEITEKLKDKKESYPFGENSLSSHPKTRL
jgi:hypothetical protein